MNRKFTEGPEAIHCTRRSATKDELRLGPCAKLFLSLHAFLPSAQLHLASAGLAETCPAHLDRYPVLSNTHILRRHRQQYRLRSDSQSFLVCAECLFDAGSRRLSPATNSLDNNVLSNSYTSQTASRNIFPDSGGKHNKPWGSFSVEDSLLIHGASFAPYGAAEAITSRSQGQE